MIDQACVPMILSLTQTNHLRSVLLGYATPYGQRLTAQQGEVRKSILRKLAEYRQRKDGLGELAHDQASAGIDLSLLELEMLNAAIHRMPSFRGKGPQIGIALLRALVKTAYEAERNAASMAEAAESCDYFHGLAEAMVADFEKGVAV